MKTLLKNYFSYQYVTQASKRFTKNPVSVKVIVIITALAIIYQIYASEFADQNQISFADFSYGLSALAVGIAGLIIAKRYSGSPIFGKTYLILAIGFILLFIGDLVYNYSLMVLNEDPYPSAADIFFIGFYFFTGYHLVKNIQYFKKDLGWGIKIGVTALTILVVIVFGILTIETLDIDPILYYMGILYVSASSAILSLAILGATIFRRSVLGIAWFMLVIGIFFYTFADVWYYYTEAIGEFTIVHPVNTLWVLSSMFMVYALYKHKKII